MTHTMLQPPDSACHTHNQTYRNSSMHCQEMQHAKLGAKWQPQQSGLRSPAEARLASAPASSAAPPSCLLTRSPSRSRLLSISSSSPRIFARRSCSVAMSASAATYRLPKAI